jgi:hypothetical protein
MSAMYYRRPIGVLMAAAALVAALFGLVAPPDVVGQAFARL